MKQLKTKEKKIKIEFKVNNALQHKKIITYLPNSKKNFPVIIIWIGFRHERFLNHNLKSTLCQR